MSGEAGECMGVGSGRRLSRRKESVTVSIYSPRLTRLNHQDHLLSDSDATARPS